MSTEKLVRCGSLVFFSALRSTPDPSLSCNPATVPAVPSPFRKQSSSARSERSKSTRASGQPARRPFVPRVSKGLDRSARRYMPDDTLDEYLACFFAMPSVILQKIFFWFHTNSWTLKTVLCSIKYCINSFYTNTIRLFKSDSQREESGLFKQLTIDSDTEKRMKATVEFVSRSFFFNFFLNHN